MEKISILALAKIITRLIKCGYPAMGDGSYRDLPGFGVIGGIDGRQCAM